MMINTIKTRFCPSPTGLMHLGNARTALFNALLANKVQLQAAQKTDVSSTNTLSGTFLLRIEDTDQTRSAPHFTQALKKDLNWLELIWQEGPDCNGHAGPYYQSQRQLIYNTYYAQLETKNKAYPCFCTEAALASARKRLRQKGLPPRYIGTCRHLTTEQVQAKILQGLKPTLRFRVPDNQSIAFSDFIKGPQRFSSKDIGDFIIRRADGTPPFMFCNAIDDSLMGVTHVLRGEDHLTNTPRQILLLEALGCRIPQYGHMSLIVGHDGAPLSKRNGSQSIQELRDIGFLSIAVINYMARLGHHYPDTHGHLTHQLMRFNELSTGFSIQSLSSSPTRFDKNQLIHWQKIAVLALNEEAFWNWIAESKTASQVPQLLVSNEQAIDFFKLTRENCCFPSDLVEWANIFCQTSIKYSPDALTVLQQTGTSFFKQVSNITVSQPTNLYSDWIKAIEKATHRKGKSLFWPLRIALTGRSDGPLLRAIFDWFTKYHKDWIDNRMHQVIQSIEANKSVSNDT